MWLTSRMEQSEVGTVDCDYCDKRHVAEFHHISQYGGQRTYAVICTTNNPEELTDYYLHEVVSFSD